MKFASNADVCVVAPSGDFRNSRSPAFASATLACLLYTASMGRPRAADRADYHFESYSEENGRIQVMTQGLYFDTTLKPWMSLKGNFIYDAISGATPRGTPFQPGTNAVNTVQMDDTRYAGFLEPTFKFANHTLSPQGAYSRESDYESIGISLNDAIDFNDKNTTLVVGVSHSFDRILPNEGELTGTGNPITNALRKDSTDVLLGVTQLLGPATVVACDLTLGYASGYLSDPYKRVLFDNYPYFPGPDPANPNPFTGWPENRPDHKFRQVVFLSLSHNFDKLAGAAEASYRFHHDDFGVLSHTVSIQWNQKAGRYVVISPLFRFYTQTAANFYGTHFPGDPNDPLNFPLPRFYSSDYRLSALNSFTYGLAVTLWF
jgi:Protein of unknown function (DUF3570)